MTFASTTTIYIQVTDQYGQSIQSHPVRVEYGEKVFDTSTDGLGEICLPDILYLDASMQLSVAVGDLGQGIFRVDYPESHITMQVNIPEKIQYYLLNA